MKRNPFMLVFINTVKKFKYFKKATFVREFKIPAVPLNQLKKDYLNFGLTYFYEFKYPYGFDEWSKNDIFLPNKAGK